MVACARGYGVREIGQPETVDELENDHVRQLILDAEHAGPAIPAHHLDRGDLRPITTAIDTRRTETGT